jgi:enoyl-[acyl-carrier protein] reductase/trans-2-enoyl-CoA reductase (NAD+)
MIIHPKVRGFICTTAHPAGCAQHVQEQIDYIRKQKPLINGPLKVLVVGASTGYGLASRIAAAFGGSRASTVGVFFEKEAEDNRTASAGWYNTVGFEEKAHKEGIYAKSINGDAFSDEIKQKTIELIKKDLGKVDLFIYSLASPRRLHPKTGVLAKSVLKPINTTVTQTSINLSTDKLERVTLESATQDEIDQTISVMGGEDWEMWCGALEKNGLIGANFLTVAYSYVGPELTKLIYRSGTIGKAKEHLEATAKKLHAYFQPKGGRAYVSVNKALVTQSSSAIPFIPLYFIILSKVMKEKKCEEGCVEQIYRLFSQQLYSGKPVSLDLEGLIRMDDWETRADVQAEVRKRWDCLTDENLPQVSDLDSYHNEFLRLFGFGLQGVDYNADVNHLRDLPSNGT